MLTQGGLLNLPPEVLERHGIHPGGEVVVEETDGGILLRSLDRLLDGIQAESRRLLEGRDAVTVEGFLEERRREAAADDR